MEKFLTRTLDDLTLDTIGLRKDLAAMLSKIETVAELAWLREQLDIITQIEFGRRLNDRLPLTNEAKIMSDQETALAYTE